MAWCARKIGRTRTCHIDTNTPAAAERWLEARRSQWNTHLDRLGDYLDRTADRPSSCTATSTPRPRSR